MEHPPMAEQKSIFSQQFYCGSQNAIICEVKKMANQDSQNDFQHLPPCAAVFIGRVIKKMRYRKKVCQEVQAELVAHFEDGLKDCTTDQEKEQAALKLIADFGDIKLLALLLRRAKKRCR